MTFALVIDDNRQAADALCSMLRMFGMEARAVYNPGPAMAILEDAIPQIIFLDINMPGVDGFEVLSFLKREPRLENVPVVIVTSDDQPETSKRALHGGANTVICKPVMVEMLEKALKKSGIQ